MAIQALLQNVERHCRPLTPQIFKLLWKTDKYYLVRQNFCKQIQCQQSLALWTSYQLSRNPTKANFSNLCPEVEAWHKKTKLVWGSSNWHTIWQPNKIVAHTLPEERELCKSHYTEASFEKASRILLFCSWVACLQTRASVAWSSFSKRTRACFLPLDSKILALIMLPWGDRCATISSFVIFAGRLETWIILVGAQQ